MEKIKKYVSQLEGKEIKREIKEDKDSRSLLASEGFYNQIHPFILKINNIIKWDIDLARSVCLDILVDVNDHEMARKLNKLFTDEIK